MTQEQLSNLFKPFIQADSSTTRKYGGTGLGLSICKELIELMGGEIDVTSVPEEGSCFFFEMTFDQASEQNHVNPIEHDREANHIVEKLAARALSVLVAEDNEVNLMVIKGMLKKINADITVVINGQEAIETLQSTYESNPDSKEPFDIIFMDCEMPVMDGYQAAREVRAYEESIGLSRVPIVALTAHAIHEHNQKCLECGMDGFLSKPLTFDRLMAELHRVTHNRE